MNKTRESFSTEHSSLGTDTRQADEGIFHILRNIIVNFGIYNILLLTKISHSI